MSRLLLPLHRRAFLRGALRFAAGSTTMGATAGMLNAVAAGAAQAATGDYKALVCLFLYGGNDGLNWWVPRDSAGYAVYAAARPGLAIPRDQLLALAPASGLDLGLHPACPGLASLFAQQRAALVANCGVLRAPVTKADVLANRNLPPALFSHNDQSDHWMSGNPGAPRQSGWAGRLDQLLSDQNGSSPLAMNLSLAGNNLFQSGGTLPAYILNAQGASLIDQIHHNSANYYPYLAQIGQGERSASALERSLARAMRNAFDVGEVVGGALDDTAPPVTAFPGTSGLAQNLRMVAHLIKANALLGVKRQVFFVGFGGFDTHDRQAEVQPQLLAELDGAVSAFQAEMAAQARAEQVTLFTMSDFGRTLTINGDGTDHGWGSHHLVVGGAVRGGEVYGTMPDLSRDGPDDAGYGRIIPTSSVDQVGATLAYWFGVPAADLPLVFPNLPRFTPRRLGFMAAP